MARKSRPFSKGKRTTTTRQQEGDGKEGGLHNEANGGASETDKRQLRQRCEGGLPDATLGTGPPWRLCAPYLTKLAANDAGGDYEARRRCEMLLEQALSCSEHADVRFVFDGDDTSMLGGHWGMLSCVCEVFCVMHSCGMEEARIRKIHIVGISRVSFIGFLEWLYLGRAGKGMAGADGREVWLLAERYQVSGIKDWLMKEGLQLGYVCAAAQYALEGDGEGRDELLKACRGKDGSIDLRAIKEGYLIGVSACALREVLEGHKCGGDGVFEAERAMRRFRVVERWAGVNKVVGCDHDHLPGLMDAVDLSRLPLEFIGSVVRPSALVTPDHLMSVKSQGIEELSVGDVRLHRIKWFGPGGVSQGEFNNIFHIAVSLQSEGEPELLAVVDPMECQVSVLDVESGACVMTLGTEGGGPGQFRKPEGVAFNKRGDLIVTDAGNFRVQVFNRQGVHVRSFGSKGWRDGQFEYPTAVAVNSQGNIVVCDGDRNCVQIFDEDGTFIRKFSSYGRGKECLHTACGIAVGPDDNIVVVDPGNARVQVFSPEGSHMMTIGSKGEGRGQFLKPYGLCVGSQGEIIVSDWERENVQVFSQSGQLMQCIGLKGDSLCDVRPHNGVAVDSRGRLFVAHHRVSYPRQMNVVMLWRGTSTSEFKHFY